ncbi:MAG TPA: long-chain fatty acid--CoA ligase [Acidimicrobiia bacterium]|nr:long-chain fatty acid--CoA ligase [Acidimicrobiia bacterium]
MTTVDVPTSVPIEGDTIVDALRENVRRIPDRPALRSRRATGWQTITYEDYGRAVAEVTAGLAELGVDAGQHVGIFSNNCAEWHLADFGILANRCVTVPVYQTSSAEQVLHILGNGETALCFVEGHELAARILEVREDLPKLDRIVVFDNDDRLDDPFTLGFAQLRTIGAARLLREPDLFDIRAGAVLPGDLATLVYTSGTTGPPKGAMVSHANIMWTLRSAVSLMQIHEGERLLSFLPLSHIAERMISDFASVAVGAETWFARSLSTVAEDLRECRPTVFFAVPRVWEKLQEAVTAKLDEVHGVKRLAVDRYIGLGVRLVADRATADRVPIWERLPYDALDASVGAKIRRDMGFADARILISAAAPIHPDLIRWFHAIGLPILELYGQTETCGPTTCNPPTDNRIGTVGPPIPGERVEIAADGEILVKGGNVCLGYFRDPTATAALIDENGWMHSGDVGHLDAAGYLTVTGRKKDLIITAHGQNIAPQEIETDLRRHDLVSEAVVIGEGRRYLTALLTLDGDTLSAWADAHHKVGGAETLAGDPDLRAEIDEFVAAVNAKRSRVERVRKYRILAHDFTIAAGELTPTLKVKRGVVNSTYRDVIDAMYAEG